MGWIRGWACVWAGWAMVLLSGCATGGFSYGEMSGTIPPVQANACRVFFYRSASMIGAALQPDIRFDAQVVGRSQPGGFFYVDTLPGRHLVTSQTEVEARLEFDLAAGQTMYVASSIGLGILVGRVHLNMKPEPTALSELASLRYTGVSPAPGQPAGTATAEAPPPRVESPTRRAGVSMADLEQLLPPSSGTAAR
jgi:hypothetical protein